MNTENINKPCENQPTKSGLIHRLVRYKLWRVNLRSPIKLYDGCYVVAEDSHSAYMRVREELDERNYGFSKDRELMSIELLAEDYKHTDTPSILLLPNVRDE